MRPNTLGGLSDARAVYLTHVACPSNNPAPGLRRIVRWVIEAAQHAWNRHKSLFSKDLGAFWLDLYVALVSLNSITFHLTLPKGVLYLK